MKKTKDCIIDVSQAGGLELSNSKMKVWRTCQYSYFFKYVQRLSPMRKSRSLTVGSWVHECLEAKNRGKSMNDRFKELVEKEWKPLFQEEKNELGNVPNDVRRMLLKYNQAYKENDKRYTPVLIERDFMIQIPKTEIILTGKIDRIVVDDQDRYWIWEYKTAKKIPENEMQQIIDPQTAIYQYVLQRIIALGILPKKPIAGVVYDYIRNKLPSDPFVLKSGGLSVAKNKLGCDYSSYLAKIKELGLDPADYSEVLSQLKAKESEFLRRIAVTKDPNTIKRIMRDIIFTGTEMRHRGKQERPYFPRNINYLCTSNNNKCDYADACILDLQGHDYTQLIGVLYERRKKDEQIEEERTS